MPVANGSFEQGYGGQPADWIVSSDGALKEFAEFHEIPHPVGFERFGASWSGVHAYWHLDESSGTLVSDSSGNERHGETVNMEDGDWGNAKVNNGLRFDGVDESVKFGTIGGFDLTSAFSIEFWFFHDSSVGARDIIGKWDTGSGKGYYAYLATNKRVGFKMADGTGALEVLTSTSGLVDDWHHVVITLDGSHDANNAHIYLDNVDESLTITSNTLALSILSSAEFTMGDVNVNFPFYGVLDEVLVYDKELTVSEVADRWNSGDGTGEMPPYVDMTWVGSYSGYYVDLDLPIFDSGPGQEDHEDFEEGWGAILLVLSITTDPASFDTTPEDFEDFEDGWGDYWWSFAWGSPDLGFASFDTSPEDFEDFEDGWTAGTQELIEEITLDLAEFLDDGDYFEFESFNDSGQWTELEL